MALCTLFICRHPHGRDLRENNASIQRRPPSHGTPHHIPFWLSCWPFSILLQQVFGQGMYCASRCSDVRTKIDRHRSFCLPIVRLHRPEVSYFLHSVHLLCILHRNTCLVLLYPSQAYTGRCLRFPRKDRLLSWLYRRHWAKAGSMCIFKGHANNIWFHS
jgi:hypothetical protein